MRKTFCSCPRCRSGKCGVCNEMSSNVLSHSLIRTEQDMFDLNIVDWGRLNGYWRSPAAAAHTLASWFANTSHATLLNIDIRHAPARNDFPRWEHVGGHVDIGRLYWNWFQYMHKGELIFSDSPDFYGTITFDEGDEHHFFGDIGKVSPMALALTQKQMLAGDVWITIRSATRQLLIEPFVSLFGIWSEMDASLENTATHTPLIAATADNPIVQAALW